MAIALEPASEPVVESTRVFTLRKEHKQLLTRMIALLLGGAVMLLAPSDPTQTKTRYTVTGNEATLVGFVSVKGKTDPPKRIDLSSDPTCAAAGLDKTQYIVRNGDKLSNAFVYLKSGETLRLLSFETPSAPVVLHQQGCQYSPRIVGVVVNQPLSIENTDLTYHNVHPYPKLNREFNRSQPPSSPPIVTKFERAEFGIPIRCNQHPWEKAFISVFDHPFFATSDLLGRFEIRGIPAGRYEVVAWHEVLGEQETEITLVPGEVRNLEFVFAGNAK